MSTTKTPKLWSGRFSKSTDQLVEAFNASINFDVRLAQADIFGSCAHAKMLAKCQIISYEESEKIILGLKKIAEKIINHQVQFTIADEDIHMNIERLLFKEIGETAGKLHTGRSRNDQTALDLHIYLREQVWFLVQAILHFQQALMSKAQEHIDTLMPGYTHLQRAQPIRLAHHLLAYVNMLQRDIGRLLSSWPRINTLPLGAGALAGASLNIDRHYLAELLNFDHLYLNSLDAVSDRDFVVEFLSTASLIMMHLSRLSEELILWSSQEFNFIELDDAFCTGSSMMPQKKNPDVAELTRGKTGRVYGSLQSILTMLKGLPLAYNKDMQEDKEGLFDTLDTLQQILQLYPSMIETMKVNVTRMREAVTDDFANATQLADYLVKKNIPFREAHAIVGQLVLYAIQQKKWLHDLSVNEFQQFSTKINEDIYHELALEQVVEARNSLGGTAKNAVAQQIITLKQLFKNTEDWLRNKHHFIYDLTQLEQIFPN